MGVAGEQSLKRRVYRELEPEAREAPGLSWSNRALTVLILVAVFEAVVETEPLIAGGRELLFHLLEFSLGLIFLAEYAARLWIAVENPAYAKSRFPRLRYAVTPIAIIDLLAVLPSLFAFGGGGTLVLRFFRILRMLRLAKLGRTSRAWQAMIDAVYDRRYELTLTFAILLVATMMGGSLVYWAEADAQPEKFGSIPRAIWWAIITLTTVGYGDTFPITPMGKFFGGMFAILGIALFALPTGIFAASFSDALQRHRQSRVRDSEDAK